MESRVNGMGLSLAIWTQSHIRELLSSGGKRYASGLQGCISGHAEKEEEKGMIVSVR